MPCARTGGRWQRALEAKRDRAQHILGRCCVGGAGQRLRDVATPSPCDRSMVYVFAWWGSDGAKVLRSGQGRPRSRVCATTLGCSVCARSAHDAHPAPGASALIGLM